MTRILISAAERSGDAHAARLVAEVCRKRPEVRFEGFGGELLAASGCKVHRDLIACASMGFGFLSNVGRYLEVIAAFDRLLREIAPRAVILVDSPGLHFIFARLARWHGVPAVYYICPQIWAWAPWRRAKVLRYTDLLLPIFPFEEELYRNPSVPVTYVGHPLGDSLGGVDPRAGERIRERLRIPRGARVIGILPGSRAQEVQGLMPLFRSIIDGLGLDPAGHRILISSFLEGFKGRIEDMLLGCRIPHEILYDDSRAIALASDVVLVASGTASLEVAFFQKPMVVLYRVGRAARFFFRLFAVTPYFSLPNILGASIFDGEPIVPERLCVGGEAAALLPVVRALMDDTPEREETIRRLGKLKAVAFAPGASARAAEALLGFLERRD